MEASDKKTAWRPSWWRGRSVVIGIPYFWLLLFFLAPFLIVANYSVSEMGAIRAEDIATLSDGALKLVMKYTNYQRLLPTQDTLYLYAYWASIKYAFVTTFFCLLVGYPFAYFMARARQSLQPTLLMLVMLPFWTSFLLRVYAWKGLLDEGGWVAWVITKTHFDHVLVWLGVIEVPGQLMHTTFSLIIGMTYTYLPFMILPLYANLSKMDLRLLEAASDLGATPWVAFWRVTVPLSKAGIIAGSMLVFIPCVGEYVTPDLLGGPSTLMIGRVIWDENFNNNDPPMAAAVAVVLVLLIVVPLAYFNKYQAEAQEARK
jgi:putrescine transport system permease protein